MLRIAGILALVLLGGCETMATTSRPQEYYAAAGTSTGDQFSLLSSDAVRLADDELQRMLEYAYVPQPLSRVALVPIGWEWRSRWSQDLAETAAVAEAGLLNTLRDSPQIYDASFLPAMLVPERPTVPKLREAAARYQADLLLAFSSSCDAFLGDRLLKPDSARAYCRVEAALLDVRTGLVPFSAASLQMVETTENESDLMTQETALRAEVDAISTALAEIADAIVVFVQQEPPAR